ncbi:hypothetical protein Tco_0231353 [Tanacetum coccineum]
MKPIAGTDISQKDEKPSKKRQNRTRDGKKVDKYISVFPDNIYGNVKSARPKTLDETIELANDLMDQKLRTYAERQYDNKRKGDDSSRNNHGHQQQPFKRQNVAKVYNMGTDERKPYRGSLPKCTKCHLHHNGPCTQRKAEWNLSKLKNNFELTPAEAIQADCDIKAINIILQGLPTEIYALVSQHRVAKDLWEKIKLLMQGTSLTKQEHECKLYDEFDKFTYKKGEIYMSILEFHSVLLNI